MKRILSNFSLTVTLLAVLALLLALTPIVYSLDLSKQEKAATFLGNVVGLDMAKYEVKLMSQMDFSADASGVAKSTMLYNLKSQGSTLEVICNFRNNALVSCIVNPLEGTPLLAQPITNALDSAKNLLSAYQSYSKAAYIQPMRAMLNTVTELKPMTIASGDLKLTVTTKDYVYIEWMNTPNGIHNMYNRVILAFQNGAFKMFSDSWNRYPMGSANVVISKENAISIAKTQAQSFSYEVGNITIGNLTISGKSEFVRANLTMQPKVNALYPHWEVFLPLDKVYPGFTTGIYVTLWADSGEIISIKATGSLGGPLSEDPLSTPAPSPEMSANTQIINDPTSPVNIYLIAGIAVAVTAVSAVTAIAIKKRSK